MNSKQKIVKETGSQPTRVTKQIAPAYSQQKNPKIDVQDMKGDATQCNMGNRNEREVRAFLNSKTNSSSTINPKPSTADFSNEQLKIMDLLSSRNLRTIERSNLEIYYESLKEMRK